MKIAYGWRRRDKVRIYSRALSADEVRSHYLGGISMHKNSGNNLVFYAGNAVLTTDVSGLSGWHHAAGTYASNDARLWLDGKQVASDTTVTVTSGLNFDSSCYFANDEKNAMEFSGVMDEARVLNYAKTGFGGGVVINKVTYDPTSGNEEIELYNNAGSTVDIKGWVFKDVDGNTIKSYVDTSQEISSGGTLTISLSGDNLGTLDSVSVYDLDTDNAADNVEENSFGSDDYKFMVDFVAWREDGSSIPATCNDATDDAVKAGLWIVDTVVANSGGEVGVMLTTTGNNDEAVVDWQAIPEFSEAFVPLIAIVALFVVFRRKRKNWEISFFTYL